MVCPAPTRGSVSQCIAKSVAGRRQGGVLPGAFCWEWRGSERVLRFHADPGGQRGADGCASDVAAARASMCGGKEAPS